MDVDTPQTRPVLAAGKQLHAGLLETVNLLAHSSSGSQEPTSDHRLTLVQNAAPLFAQLRAIARRAYDESRKGKRSVADARIQVDTASLALQNLDYQKRHLEDEIRTCRDFQSVYQTIALTDLDDFRERAPAEDTTKDIMRNLHALQLARLRFELSERKRMEAEKQAVQAQKARLAQGNRTKRQRLEGLEHDLKVMISSGGHVRRRFKEANRDQERLRDEKTEGPEASNANTAANSTAPASPDAEPTPQTTADDAT